MTLASATDLLTAASTRAARHWAGNLRALATVQPEIIPHVQSLSVQGEWVFARDGSLTLLDGDRWIGGCSMPYRAAVAMLKTLDPSGSVACFLSPSHAAEIKASLERFSEQQAVIALQPDWQTLRTILACEDFSADLAAHRLFFAVGPEWCAGMRSLFEQHPGLPTPQQFIKLPTLTSEMADPLITPSQTLFGEVLQARAERIRAVRDEPRASFIQRTKALPVTERKAPRIGVIANSQFKLWEDAGAALAEALCSGSSYKALATQAGAVAPVAEVKTLDPDVPILAGPVATAEFCRECDAVVTADSARCDFPDVLPLNLPWVTWVTRGRIPTFAAAGTLDALLLSDADWRGRALEAGWPAGRVDVATFPRVANDATKLNSALASIAGVLQIQTGLAASGAEGQRFVSPPLSVTVGDRASLATSPTIATKPYDGWTILADTVAIEMPKKLDDFSSHCLLWESIFTELTADPFAVGQDVGAYLRKRAKSVGVDESAVDARLFVDSLIVPAFQQATVRAMRKAGVHVRAFGRGWSELEEFSPIAVGPIESRVELAAAIASSARLVHLWPSGHAHPIDAAGRPVLRRTLSRLESFVQQAKRPETLPAMKRPAEPISLRRVLSVLPTEFHPLAEESRLY